MSSKKYLDALEDFHQTEELKRFNSICAIHHVALSRCSGVLRQIENLRSLVVKGEKVSSSFFSEYGQDQLDSLSRLIAAFDDAAKNEVVAVNPRFKKLSQWLCDEMILAEVQTADKKLRECIKIAEDEIALSRKEALEQIKRDEAARKLKEEKERKEKEMRDKTDRILAKVGIFPNKS